MDHSALHERADETHSERAAELPLETINALAIARRALAASADVRHVVFDDLSDVRYLHALALKDLASGEFSDEELASVKAVIYSDKYVNGLGSAISQQQFFGAWIGQALVGTCGWSVTDDAIVARVRSVFVSPIYKRMGLAQKLLIHSEQHATAAGCQVCSVRSMANATGFFVRQGYTITSHGVRSILPGRSVPVTFLRRAIT